MIHRNRAGQLLIMALIVLALLVATVPILLTLSSQLSKHFTSRASKERIADVARGAFAYVSYVFESQPDAWSRAMQGDALKDLGFDGSRNFQGVQNTVYTVRCSRDATLSPGQLKVDINVVYQNKSVQKTNLFQSIASYPTMGVDLADKTHAAAALYVVGDIDLENTGGAPAELDVNWGSIVCFGSLHVANEPNEALYGHHPRKFLHGDFQSQRSMEDKGEHRDYWTNVPMGNPIVIDEDKYQYFADSQMSSATAVVQGQAISFRGSTSFIEGKPPIYFINSAVRFESEGIDLGVGAMIISGYAMFDGQKDGLPLSLHVPASADQEYPFLPEGASFPCEDKLGASCASSDATADGKGLIDYRGFLYVKGDLFINQNTVIVGVVRVDGKVHIAPGKRLTIFYDDQVSHAIPLKGTVLQQRIISQPL